MITLLADDLGLKKTRFSCHVLCPGFQESCSLFFTLIPTPTRSCQGIACHNCDFYPLQLDSPVQSQLLLGAFGHSFEAEAPQPRTT